MGGPWRSRNYTPHSPVEFPSPLDPLGCSRCLKPSYLGSYLIGLILGAIFGAVALIVVSPYLPFAVLR